MTAATSSLDAFRPRPAEAWRYALWLALLAHGLLLVALMFGVRWHTAKTPTVEAEMWSEIPRAAVPAAEPPPPPAPAPAPPPPTPTPTPTPTPPAPEPPPAPAAEPPPPPPQPVEIPVKRAPKHAPPPPRPPKVKVEPKPKIEPKPKPAPEPKAIVKPVPIPKEAAPLSNAQTKAEAERARKENLDRMMNDLSQDRLHSAGPSADHAGRIKARIKPNIVFTDSITGNPLATVEVRCSPTGQITGRKLLTSSGVQAWDDAVLRAIDRTEVLPLDEKGRIPAVMQIDFRPKDF